MSEAAFIKKLIETLGQTGKKLDGINIPPHMAALVDSVADKINPKTFDAAKLSAAERNALLTSLNEVQAAVVKTGVQAGPASRQVNEALRVTLFAKYGDEEGLKAMENLAQARKDAYTNRQADAAAAAAPTPTPAPRPATQAAPAAPAQPDAEAVARREQLRQREAAEVTRKGNLAVAVGDLGQARSLEEMDTKIKAMMTHIGSQGGSIYSSDKVAPAEVAGRLSAGKDVHSESLAGYITSLRQPHLRTAYDVARSDALTAGSKADLDAAFNRMTAVLNDSDFQKLGGTQISQGADPAAIRSGLLSGQIPSNDQLVQLRVARTQELNGQTASGPAPSPAPTAGPSHPPEPEQPAATGGGRGGNGGGGDEPPRTDIPEPEQPSAGADNDPWSASNQTKARVDAERNRREEVAEVELRGEREKDRRGIRGGMGKARGDASQGLKALQSATDYDHKLAAYKLITGAQDDGKPQLDGFRRTGWISDDASTYETASVTSHYLVNHQTADGHSLFDNKLYKKHLRDYLAEGSFDQKFSLLGPEFTDFKAEVAKAKKEQRPIDEKSIDKALDLWTAKLRKEYDRNVEAGVVTKLDKDGFRTSKDLVSKVDNRSMTPLADDNTVVDNPPGAWFRRQEWDKLHTEIYGDLKHSQYRELVDKLRTTILPKENTADFDADAAAAMFKTMRQEIVNAAAVHKMVPDLMTDSAKFDADVIAARAEGRAVPTARPTLRAVADLRQDLMDGKVLSDSELNSIQTDFFGNKFKAQSRESARAFNALLNADNTVDLNVDGAGGVNEQLNKLKPIINQKAYQDFAQRSASGAAHDAAVKTAQDNGTAIPVRKAEDIRKDVINGDKVTESELTQLTEHYRAVLVLAKTRAEVREIQDLLRREGTSDLIVDAKHPQAGTVGGKGLHERLEEIRKLEQIPNFREHYPLSASAQAAITAGTKRSAAEILADLTSDHRVSRDELFQLEGHFRAGYLRATVAETIEKAVKFSPPAEGRGKALQELAEGSKPLDNVVINNQSVPRTLDAALQDVRRRVIEEETWLRQNGMLPQNAPAGRPIHAIVEDFSSGRLSASNTAGLSLEDAKVFAERYRAYVAGEGMVAQNKEIMDRLYTVYESSNGIGKRLGKEDKATLRADFDTLKRNMMNPSYNVFMEHVLADNPDAGKTVRRDMDVILNDMREGNPVHKDELTRVREFFDRWHTEGRASPGRLAAMTGARYWDRRLDAMVPGALATGAAGVGGVVLATGIGLGAAGNAINGGSAPTTGGPAATQPGGAVPSVSGAPQRGTLGYYVDRVLGGAGGAIEARTSETVAAGAMIHNRDDRNAATYAAEARRLADKISQRGGALTDADISNLAAGIAQEFRRDQTVTLAEAARAAVQAASTDAGKAAAEAYQRDVEKAKAGDRVLLPAPPPPSGP